MATIEVQRAYRVTLDPTRAQTEALARHAGAARDAYNAHLAAKRDAHRAWSARVADLTYLEYGHLTPDVALTAARRTATADKALRIPSYMDSIKSYCADPDKAWHVEVNRYALTSGMRAADAAWTNWVASLRGTRAGARVGYPRFHKKGRSRDSFTLYHDVKRPSLRPDGYRRLNLPGKAGGSIRVHGNLRRLARRIARGTAVIASVTISRGGRHWYASILARETITVPAAPTQAQQAGGVVGVDVGIRHLAALSTGELIPNPRHLSAAQKRLHRAQRALSRAGWWRASDGALLHNVTTRVPRQPTRRRVKAQARLARAHADVAQARATTVHALTKTLTTRYAVIAIEDLNVKGMSASARGTTEAPGRNVAAKAGLNRAVLDAAFSEIRRHLTYKTTWYGSRLVVIDRWAPTSKTCSTCGTVKPKLALAERTYRCPACGMTLDRDINAAKVIATLGAAQLDDAPGKEESRNARRGGRPPRGRPPLTREGQDPRAPATPVPEGPGHPPRDPTTDAA